MSAAKRERQKKLGPAPFASFDDLGDDLSSPESKGYRPMPEIYEDIHQLNSSQNDASTSTSTAQTPTTPRIDVEQASTSPSQGTSGDDSTPERELFGMNTAHVRSAFLEGAADVDLRSSAKEMHIPAAAKSSSVAPPPVPARQKAEAGRTTTASARSHSSDCGDSRLSSQHQPPERRTTPAGRGSFDPFVFPQHRSQERNDRLSSISSNMSATSGMSGLSAFSARRSPSPHRMLLETSFVGPKALNKQAESDDEADNVSRRPSLLNPMSWLGEAGSRSASPGMHSPSSPTSMRSFMVKYATEPRSRPTSPMGWRSGAPSPLPDVSGQHRPSIPGYHSTLMGGDPSSSSRWLSSPRCQRRASSPHRTLVETSFCGPKKFQVPEQTDSAVMPRAPSPAPPTSLVGSLLSIRSQQPFKYATEPRSRPASPTPMAGAGGRHLLGVSPVPPESRRGSMPGRCPSPMIETSFCGPKRIARRDSGDDALVVSVSPLPPSIVSGRDSRRASDVSSMSSLKPIRYATEPRSRPTSPAPSSHQAPSLPGFTPTLLDSPRLSRRASSPHRTVVETSFVTKTTTEGGDRFSPPAAVAPVPPSAGCGNVVGTTQVSIHPLPIRYDREPRSRPVSPYGGANHSNQNCPATPEPERRSHSPMIETSFVSAGRVPVATKDPALEAYSIRDVVNKIGDESPQHQLHPQHKTPVKYATEPRSRSVSPNPTSRLGSNDDSSRRSPSPHRSRIETSFVGNGNPAVQQRQQIDDGAQQPAAGVDRRQSSDDISFRGSISSINNHLDEHRGSSSSSLLGAAGGHEGENDVAEEEEEEDIEFVTSWPEEGLTDTSGWAGNLDYQTKSPGVDGASSIESASPPSQTGNDLAIALSRQLQQQASAANSDSSPRPGRQKPKPVACPKPPDSFSSTQSSPLGSPALFRRGVADIGSETGTPSPSSPFPSRRTSFTTAAAEQPQRKTSITAASPMSDEPMPGPVIVTKHEGKHAKEAGKSRSVLSALFSKRPGSGKKGKGGLFLPGVKSRDVSPGRSMGELADDPDDDDDDVPTEGFQHRQFNEASCDEPTEACQLPAVPIRPKEELGIINEEEDEDELPYVPTTLPIERPIAPFITPVRVRMMSEVKTTPIERPRCSVAFTPKPITEYVKILVVVQQPSEDNPSTDDPPPEKLRVSLPRPDREDSLDGDETTPVLPPIKVTTGSVAWEAFAGQVFAQRKNAGTKEPQAIGTGSVPAPALPTDVPAPSVASQWINVEDLPEPVKEAKSIQLIKHRQHLDSVLEGGESQSSDHHLNAKEGGRKDSVSSETALLREIDETELEEDRSPPDDEDDENRRSPSSSVDLDDVELPDVLAAARSALTVRAPFGMDLDIHSNRSSIAITGDIPSPDDVSISTQ